MLKFGFDLDGGWLSPQEHIASTRVAEKLGYDSVWMGDHFLPWFHSDAQAPAVWPWLGAALASSSSIKIGPSVTVPIGGRYHPLLVAQQAATLDNMFPNRFVLGLGTGQAMSEERFLGNWPAWNERGERLREAIRLMRKFWTEEDYFDWDGRYFQAKKVYLYTRPSGRIELYIAARGKHAARIAGSLGDHLITTVSDPGVVRRDIISEFEKAMLRIGRNPAKAYRIGYIEFGIGDVNALVRLMRNGAAAQGLVEAARSEKDPRRIQELGSQAPTADIVRHHHLVAKGDALIPVAQDLINAGCNYIIFSDVSRKPNQNMITIMEEVIPHLRERQN